VHEQVVGQTVFKLLQFVTGRSLQLDTARSCGHGARVPPQLQLRPTPGDKPLPPLAPLAGKAAALEPSVADRLAALRARLPAAKNA